MHASSSSVNPTPLAHADTQRDNHPRGYDNGIKFSQKLDKTRLDQTTLSTGNKLPFLREERHFRIIRVHRERVDASMSAWLVRGLRDPVIAFPDECQLVTPT
ncbi:hypothetical protein TNCV_2389681 [Trichonephila clavipes]|nr:hypothetical protein TNCV_2389681 [Trichonephila clavipes]